MSTPATAMDYEPAGELKIGQVGIANLRVRTLDVERLAAEMHDRVARAPKLFGRAAVIVDFGGLPATPDAGGRWAQESRGCATLLSRAWSGTVVRVAGSQGHKKVAYTRPS
jgi:septum formation inhibitor MinC